MGKIEKIVTASVVLTGSENEISIQDVSSKKVETFSLNEIDKKTRDLFSRNYSKKIYNAIFAGGSMTAEQRIENLENAFANNNELNKSEKVKAVFQNALVGKQNFLKSNNRFEENCQ